MTLELTALEIRRNDARNHPLFSGDLGLRDALADYAKLTWPASTAKHAAKAWGLSMDEGRAVVCGRASLATVEKILAHKAGGWAVFLPVIGAVIGHGVDEFIQSERRKHAQAALRERALLRDLRDLAPTRYRPAAERSVSPAEPARSVRRDMAEG